MRRKQYAAVPYQNSAHTNGAKRTVRILSCAQNEYEQYLFLRNFISHDTVAAAAATSLDGDSWTFL